MRATNITSMPQTAQEERAKRMRNYTIMMIIRTVCFAALIWVRGPWMLVFAAGAIFLPYFAVIIANAVTRIPTETVDRPSSIVLHGEAQRSTSGSTESAESEHERANQTPFTDDSRFTHESGFTEERGKQEDAA